jgi:phage tail sheath protein FI
MAESIISPGVYTRENDISFIQPAPIQAGAAFVGPTVKGPDNQPLIVTSYSDYVRKFGETVTSGSKQYEFLTSVAVKNYFQNGGQTAIVTRIVSGTYDPAISTNIESGILATTASLTINSASLAPFITPTGSFSINGITIAVTGSSTPANTASTIFIASGSTPANTVTAIVTAFNASSSVALYSASLQNIVAAASGTTGLKFNTTSSLLGTYTLSNTLNAYTSIVGGVTTNFSGATGITAVEIKTLGKGVLYNNSTAVTDSGALNSDGSLVSGSSDNIRWEIANVNPALGTFSILVRQGNDSTNSKTILETFNVNLDPNSDNYIERIIGNQHIEVGTDGSTSYNYPAGEYPNASNYIRVSAVNLATNYYLANDGITVNRDSNNLTFAASLPQVTSGSFYGAQGALKAGANFFGDITNTSTNAQGLVAANYNVALSLLSNKDEYQFNIVSAPGLIYKNSNFTSTVNAFIALAESRGDCIAVVDLVGQGEVVTNVTAQAASLNSSYAATYWPWLQIKSGTGRNEWAPAGTVIPGVYAFTDASSAPWFAPAGLVRGGIGGVIQAERKLTKGDRDTLYSAKVNPIATFPGTGIAVFGQKTLQTKSSALDRVNVRRLLIELKKFIGDQARNLVFEQNTIATRNRFLATVNPYLESVVQRQGLYAYRVVMDDTNNTADVVDRNQLVGQILIQPAKTIEFVVLDFTIEPTGATFS